DLHRLALAADLGIELRSRRSERGRHVGERDRLADARADRAAGDAADRDADVVDDRCAFAHRRTFGADQADALSLRAAAELALDRRRARVAAGTVAAGSAHFLDRPGQAGFDRRRGRVDLVAVEAQARLQAQRVARAEAG